jgi:hypothetical protein
MHSKRQFLTYHGVPFRHDITKTQSTPVNRTKEILEFLRMRGIPEIRLGDTELRIISAIFFPPSGFLRRGGIIPADMYLGGATKSLTFDHPSLDGLGDPPEWTEATAYGGSERGKVAGCRAKHYLITTAGRLC